jgi:predicted nucleic acid-binding protein
LIDVNLSFLDTSAFLKRYLAETGSAWVQSLCETETVAISALIIVEMSATLARLAREGRLTTDNRATILQQFGEHIEECLVIDIDRRQLDAASALALAVSPHIPLRSLDAIHLAAARSAFASVPAGSTTTFALVSSDRRLLAAAQWAGLATDNPETHP